MFRSRPGRDCWHFCVNCPAWPEDYDEFETVAVAARDRWCRTCVRMYEAGTGDLPALAFDIFGQLTAAWKRGDLKLR